MWRFRQILVAFSEYTNSIKESKGDTPISPRIILFAGNGRVSLIVMSRPHPSCLVNVLHNSEKNVGNTIAQSICTHYFTLLHTTVDKY